MEFNVVVRLRSAMRVSWLGTLGGAVCNSLFVVVEKGARKERKPYCTVVRLE